MHRATYRAGANVLLRRMGPAVATSPLMARTIAVTAAPLAVRFSLGPAACTPQRQQGRRNGLRPTRFVHRAIEQSVIVLGFTGCVSETIVLSLTGATDWNDPNADEHARGQILHLRRARLRVCCGQVRSRF
jgi:hypothetical protein